MAKSTRLFWHDILFGNFGYIADNIADFSKRNSSCQTIDGREDNVFCEHFGRLGKFLKECVREMLRLSGARGSRKLDFRKYDEVEAHQELAHCAKDMNIYEQDNSFLYRIAHNGTCRILFLCTLCPSTANNYFRG